ncbi:hypothetical protein [Modestobacter sp. I12A-02662]|uniref:hypothetical protein n=1 Tax=Modestobacter sp. I12A-02662 TaxID=1730496 RepID=UPI0034DFA16A
MPALVLTAALAGLTACGSTAPGSGAADSSSPPASSPAPSVPQETAGTEHTTSAGPPAATQPDTARVIALVVSAGAVSGESGRAVVELGSPVRIEVTADLLDEVHVHGYDLTADTVPGQPVSVEFTADIPGVFEVELHESGLLLTRLQVQ